MYELGKFNHLTVMIIVTLGGFGEQQTQKHQK